MRDRACAVLLALRAARNWWARPCRPQPPWPEALGLTALGAGQPLAVDTAVRLGALDVLSFLGTFTTLHPGDLVSLGTVWRREFPARGVVALDASWPGGSLAVRVEP